MTAVDLFQDWGWLFILSTAVLAAAVVALGVVALVAINRPAPPRLRAVPPPTLVQPSNQPNTLSHVRTRTRGAFGPSRPPFDQDCAR